MVICIVPRLVIIARCKCPTYRLGRWNYETFVLFQPDDDIKRGDLMIDGEEQRVVVDIHRERTIDGNVSHCLAKLQYQPLQPKLQSVPAPNKQVEEATKDKFKLLRKYKASFERQDEVLAKTKQPAMHTATVIGLQREFQEVEANIPGTLWHALRLPNFTVESLRTRFCSARRG